MFTITHQANTSSGHICDWCGRRAIKFVRQRQFFIFVMYACVDCYEGKETNLPAGLEYRIRHNGQEDGLEKGIEYLAPWLQERDSSGQSKNNAVMKDVVTTN